MIRLLCCTTILLFGTAMTAAQATPALPEKNATEKEDKLKKEAIVFLRETLGDVNAMRSLENRISFNAELAGLMWFHDEREARAMYLGVITDFRNLLVRYDFDMNALGEPTENDGPNQRFGVFGVEPTDRAKLLRKFSTAMGVRQQITVTMAEHDPDLAFGFYYDSLSAITNPGLLKQHESRDSYFEHQLLAQLVEKDAGKAAKHGLRSLELGVNYQHIELLRKIYSKDADRGADFAAAILSRLKDDKINASSFSILSSLIGFGETSLEESRKPDGKRAVYTIAQIRELAEVLAQAILSRSDEDAASGLSYLHAVQKHLPGRAAQIRAKFKVANVTPVEYSVSVGNSASNANRSYTATYEGNANVSTADVERMVRENEAREKEEKKLFDDVQSLGSKQLPKEEREKIIAQARKIITQQPGRDRKVMGLSMLASQVAIAGDKELAAEIMRDAEKLVNPAPKNYQDFILTWLLASGYAAADPDKAFPLLEDTIARANDTLAAFVKVGEFIDVAEEAIQDGEVQVGAFGGQMVRGLTRELVMADTTIDVLAKADFAKTKSLTNRFDRPEIRVLAKMMVLRAVLSPKTAPKQETAVSDGQ